MRQVLEIFLNFSEKFLMIMSSKKLLKYISFSVEILEIKEIDLEGSEEELLVEKNEVEGRI